MKMMGFSPIYITAFPPSEVHNDAHLTARSSSIRSIGGLRVEWDHEQSEEQNAARAARTFVAHYGFRGKLFGGPIPNGAYAYVLID